MAGKIKLTGKYAVLANKMLKDVTEILYKIGVPYVLEAGTLLGIVRENRLLPWDNDVDITITAQHADKLLKNLWRFYLKGYRPRVRRFDKDIGPFKKGMIRIIKVQKLKYFIFRDVKMLDIFVKFPFGDEYQWTVSVKKPVLKGVPKRFYDEIGELEYKGRKYSVPEDYEGYLEYHYGDWRTPIKEWNFRTDDKCVKEILPERGKK